MFWGGLVLFASLSACQPKGSIKPNWLSGQAHPRFSAEHFLLGKAMADSHQKASQAAIEDLQQNFLAQLANLEARNQPDWPVARAVYQEDHWVGPGGNPELPQHGVIAALPKQVLFDALATRLDTNAKRISDAQKAAHKAMGDERDPYQALLRYIQTWQWQGAWIRDHAWMSALSPKFASDRYSGLQKLSDDEIKKWSASLSLRVLRGDGQRVDADGKISQALLIGAYQNLASGPFPLADIPMLALANPDSNFPGTRARSSELGTATFSMGVVPTEGLSEGKIKIGVDTDTVLADAGFDPSDSRFSSLTKLLQAVKVELPYFVRGQDFPRVLIWIEERQFGQPQASSPLAAKIGKFLAAKGYQLIESASVADDLAMVDTLEEIPAAVKEQADLVIYGTMDSELSKVVNKRFMFCQARGQILAVQTADGRLLHQQELTTQGAGQDEYAACQRAFDAAVNEALAKLLPNIQTQTKEP